MSIFFIIIIFEYLEKHIILNLSNLNEKKIHQKIGYEIIEKNDFKLL